MIRLPNIWRRLGCGGRRTGWSRHEPVRPLQAGDGSGAAGHPCERDMP